MAEPVATTNGDINNHVNHIDKVISVAPNNSSEHKSSSKHKHSSSKHHSSDGKHHSSSSSSHKHRDGSSSKHHSSSSSSKHHSSSSSKDHKSHHSSKSHSSSSHHSSSKDPNSSSSHHSSSKDPNRKSHSSSSKHHSTSSSHKHKDGSSSHSSSKSKDGSSRHHHSSSSSSKHKHGSGSDARPSDSSPDRIKTKTESSMKVQSETVNIKTEPASPMKFHSETVTMKTELASPVKLQAEKLSPMKIKIKQQKEEDSDDDMPLNARLNKKVNDEPWSPVKHEKRSMIESDDDEEPLAKKLEKKKKIKAEKQRKRKAEDEDFDTPKKKKKKPAPQVKSEGNEKLDKKTLKKMKEMKEEETKWRWWEDEEKENSDIKWHFLEHNGPLVAPPYEPLPDHIHFLYNGKVMKLTQDTEEVAGFYGKMLDHDYTTKEVFNKNFFKDWRKVMSSKEMEIITDLKKCDFRQICEYYKEQSELRKSRSKEEKQKTKVENEAIVEDYGYCTIDGHKQKIGNFRIEPPGLFRGRGDHPKQGMLKKRTMPEDVIINCSKDSNVPRPPAGRRWKKVQHDNLVTWLACWNENIQGSTKYVMLNAASKLKGQKDWKKYEMARKLHKYADQIRVQYREDWKSKEMKVRQRSVAMYFIDKLALRAGNEKDEDQADTVGCCSLRVEHLKLHEHMGDKENVVEFDFLGKDSIRYYNAVSVEKRVFKNLQLFMDNKNGADDIFDRLNTAILNKHLQGLMDGLTAKVFRTYNASKTLQEQLDLLTNEDDAEPAKILSYNRANRAVAVLCNHQRAAPKNFSKQMENMQSKIDAKKEVVRDAKHSLKQAKADLKAKKTPGAKALVDRRKKAQERLELQLTKLQVQQTDKDENKEIALGTSKLNYLDPRISVAWAKKWEVPVEKVYNKTQREKFAWAVDMAEEDFRF